MKNIVSLFSVLLVGTGLAVAGQTLAGEAEVKAEIAKACQAEAEGAIDPEIYVQECINDALEELKGAASQQKEGGEGGGDEA